MEENGRKDERFCIDTNGNAWFVYFTERGTRIIEKRFSTEEDACKYLLEQLNMLPIDKGYRFDTFKRTAFYDGQSEDCFFWLHDLCVINGIEGKFKVGLWFQKGIIRQVQLLYMADNVTNEIWRSEIHNAIIKNKILKMNINASNISNYWDKCDQYSTIVIDF